MLLVAVIAHPHTLVVDGDPLRDLKLVLACAALHLSVHLTLGLLHRRRRLNLDGGAPVGVQGDALRERPFVGVHDGVLPPS